MPVIVTPHLGEMSRLMKKSIANIQEDIIDVAGEFASLYNVTCVLKDFRTIIAAADGEKFINLSGNCGMATAGSGDVLSGVVEVFWYSGVTRKRPRHTVHLFMDLPVIWYLTIPALMV